MPREATRRVEPTRRESFAQDLDDHPLAALPVPFPVKHPLPGSQIELARGHRNDDLVAHGEAPEVGRGVVLPGLVVPVQGGVPGCHGVLQPVQDVVPESRLVVVDEDRCRNVHCGNQRHSLPDSALLELGFDLAGDVDDLLAALGLEPEVVSVGLHRPAQRVQIEMAPQLPSLNSPGSSPGPRKISISSMSPGEIRSSISPTAAMVLRWFPKASSPPFSDRMRLKIDSVPTELRPSGMSFLPSTYTLILGGNSLQRANATTDP